MKISAAVLFLICIPMFVSCSKFRSAGESRVPAPADQPDPVVSADSGTQSLSPELQKLQRVLAALPERTQQGIRNGDPGEFLADLHAVLAADTYDLLRLVDKKHFLAADYAPADIVPLVKNPHYAISRGDLALRKPAEAALVLMADAAKADGITLLASSTYRSYAYQEIVYARNVREMGKEAADRESAAPGTSQHQLGAVVDFGSISDEFAETAAGRWLDANAARFGWSLSFPQGYEDVTGYRWECWHFRYVGVPAVEFQRKWFSNIQQFMLEFIDAWRADSDSIG
ncbi:M15 family metallopeptidase [Treponema brennaborense]|uniref:Peptidase M15B and M15C DD-carboxypeptidase VanY/endolysin n=1 Tax=Treponema brennaborense (strain DSM 12168 / CIP 105900 / DD5/3) TaxID=906968 RepID=F4LN94_TREBD|nr:M15 family metallopeptidase [Treponema brennaborense]AEE16859.1 peptidase M15B and M15C DD-carboxypeptidase VanY/endolysin [Treponema brennaborense DSM 12168]